MFAFIKSVSGSIGIGRFWLGLLFILMLTLSIFYNLPASWLISQSVVQKQVPKSLLISSVNGSVWNGGMALSTQLKNKSGAVLDLGVLQWDIDWLPLLKGNISSQQQWLLTEKSQVGFYLERDLLSTEASLHLSDLQANIDITQLLQRLASAGLGSFVATGKVVATDIDVVLNPLTLWPISIGGQFEVRSLSTFGVNLPLLTAVPSMEAQTILVNLSAQSAGWQLKGLVSVSANHRYDITLSVKAESPQQMPDWAQLMVKKTPTLATLTDRGRW
jgi:hypothetical protein